MQASDGHVGLQRLAAIATLVLCCWHGLAFYMQSVALTNLERDVERNQLTMQTATSAVATLQQSAQILDDDQLAIAARRQLGHQARRREDGSQAALANLLEQRFDQQPAEAAAGAALYTELLLRRDLGRRLFAGDAQRSGLLDGHEIVALHRQLNQLLGPERSQAMLAWLTRPPGH